MANETCNFSKLGYIQDAEEINSKLKLVHDWLSDETDLQKSREQHTDEASNNHLKCHLLAFRVTF